MRDDTAKIVKRLDSWITVTLRGYRQRKQHVAFGQNFRARGEEMLLDSDALLGQVASARNQQFNGLTNGEPFVFDVR